MDCEQMYHREFSERERLHTALSTPIGLLSIIGALLGYMFQNIRSAWTIDAVAAYVFVAAAAAAVVVAVFNLFVSMHGHTYKGVESPTRLRKFHQELREWHGKYGTGPLAGDREFEEYLQSSYAAAANRNQEVNAYRSDRLYVTSRWVIISATLAGVALIPFLINIELREASPSRVLITAPLEVKDARNQSSTSTAQADSAPAAGHSRGTHSEAVELNALGPSAQGSRAIRRTSGK